MSLHEMSHAETRVRHGRVADLMHRLRDRSLQWSWFLQGVPADRIGFGRGPLTWLRSAAHRRRSREFRICLLEPEGWFGPLTAWAINQNSKRCHAVVNGDIASADVIWVYSQDPLSAEGRASLDRAIKACARPDAAIVNAPAAYNAYHAPDAFDRLAEAGVRVPRHALTDADRGKLQVVYKPNGRHGGGKCRETYDGPRQGMTAFEFLDCRQPDGMYRRYRAHYIMGTVRPSEAFVSSDWNVCGDTAERIEYFFEMSNEEADQVRTIADVLGLQYFAVDFIRRPSDGMAVFTDVNVYPTIQSPRERVRSRKDFGGWHTFDARRRMGVPEPGGRSVWEEFDAAVAHLVEQKRESCALALRVPTSDFLSQLGRLRPANAPPEPILSMFRNLDQAPSRPHRPAETLEPMRAI